MAVFDINNPGNYVAEYTTEKVGKVSGHDYKYFEKGMDGRLTTMTCDEYIQHCVDDIFKSSYEGVVRWVDEAKVHEYARHMKQGETFPIPYLNYADGQQEGRHRAFAFKEAFGANAEFPVLEVFPVEKPPLDIIKDYCIRKYGNERQAVMMMPEIAGRWYTQKEIYKYLGLDYDEDEELSDDVELDDLDNLDDLLSDIIDTDDLDNLDEDILLEDMADIAGISVDELDDLDAADFARLVDKALNKK